MTTDDMKAAIERTKRHECCSLAEYDTVMELAEVGRLAVECRHATKSETNGRLNMYLSEDKRDDAADAFLAKHGGGG